MNGTGDRTTTIGGVGGNPAMGRRALLAGAGGAALAGAVAAPAAAVAGPDCAQAEAARHPDAALLAACARFDTVEREAAALRARRGVADGDWDALNGRWYQALDRLTPMCPRTAEGLRAKAQVAYAALISTAGPEGLASEECAALAVLADLLGDGAAPPRRIAPAWAGPADAELIEVCQQHIAIVDAIRRGGAGDSDDDPAWEIYDRTCDVITDTSAVTLAGVLAKARAAICQATNPDGSIEVGGTPAEGWAQGVLLDLLRLHGGGA